MARVEVTVSAIGRDTACRARTSAAGVGAGNGEAWLTRLAEYLCGDQRDRVLCIVPTSDAANHLQARLLTDFGVPGIFGAPICTFYNLARDIAQARRLGGHNLSDLQRQALLANIAAAADIPTLARVQHFPGFAAALGDLIGELKLAMIHPPDLRAAAERLPRSEATLRDKLRDLLTLYERYQEILDRHRLHDGEGLMWDAMSALERNPGILRPVPGSKTPASVFFLHGFRTFEPVEMRFLHAIAGHADCVFIHLLHDPDRPELFAASARTLDALRGLPGCVVHVGAVRPSAAAKSSAGEMPAPPSADDETDIGHLLAHVFERDVEQRASDGSVIILEAGGPAQEAEQVAREIRRLVAAGCACYSDMAVITRGQDARQRFAHVLGRFEVPVRMQAESLGASAAGATLLACLQVMREGWPVLAVGSVLKSPCLPGDAIERARAEVRSWELGVREGRDVWFAEWRDDDTLEVRQQALGRVKDLEDRLRQAGSIADMATAVRQFLGPLKPPEGDLAALRDDQEARGKLEDLIIEVEQIAALGPQTPPWDAFCEDLERAISGATYRSGVRRLDAVALHDAKELAGQSYRIIFAVNLLEKVFPQQARENPFLRDRERRLLADAAPAGTPVRLDLSSERQDEERLLFWRMAASANERLYLSYPAADEKAKDSLPSFYLDEVSRLFADEPRLKRTRRFSELTPPAREAVSDRDWAACILHGLARRLEPAEEAENAAQYNARLSAMRARGPWARGPIDRAEGAPTLQPYLCPAPPYADLLSDSRLLAALEARDRPYHPTELESYLTCAYMYYCARLLELEPVQREIAPADFGILFHDVLARLYREWCEQSGGPVDVTSRDAETVIARALELLDQQLARQPRFANLPAARRDIEREQMRVVLRRFVAADLEQTARRGLRPAFFELSFGAQSVGAARRGRPDAADAMPPSPLDLGLADGRRVLICGRIDRVDLTADGAALIVDYKLSKRLRDLREIETGTLLQAPLYALAVRDLLGLPVAGAEYVSIWRRDRTGMYSRALATRRSARNLTLTPEDMDAALDSAAQRARECVMRIRRGEMPRGPLDECPASCGYEGICRVDAWTLRAIQARRGAEPQERDNPRGR